MTNLYSAVGVSPDGRNIVYSAMDKSGARSLWMRPLDSGESRRLEGTNFREPTVFWSADNKSVIFHGADRQLRRLDLATHQSVPIVDPGPANAMAFTGTSNADGVVLFGSETGLQRVPLAGGESVLISAPERGGYGYPQFLPDGNHFIFCVGSNDPQFRGVYWSSLDRPREKHLIVNTSAKGVYVPPRGSAPGYLLYLRGDTLLAHRFDAINRRLEGEPRAVVEGIGRANTNLVRAGFWTSDTGVLVYTTRSEQDSSRLSWVGRDGSSLGDPLPPGNYADPSISPDGRFFAVSTGGSNNAGDVTVWDSQRSVVTRLTTDAQRERDPVWSPDSQYVAYNWYGKGIWRKAVSSAGPPTPLLEMDTPFVLLDWSRDGRRLLFSRQGGGLSILPLTDRFSAAGKPYVLANTGGPGRFSPDSRWVVYSANNGSDTNEVFVQSVLAPGAASDGPSRWQVSNGGGMGPSWRADGKEIFYKTPTGDFMSVDVREKNGSLRFSAPRKLFSSDVQLGGRHTYDVSPDGQRFLLLRGADAISPPDLKVIVNWQSLIEKE